MNKETISLRVSSKLKEDASAVLNELGIDMSTAIRLYLKQIAINKNIPFYIQLKPENRADFIKKNVGVW